MKNLENNQYQRLRKVRKSQVYKQMLDQQIRNKNQIMRQKDKKYFEKKYNTEPTYDQSQIDNLGGYSQFQTIQKRSNSFLPVINNKLNYANYQLNQQKLLNVRRPKHFQYPDVQLQSQDQTEQYLKQCQDIIHNLRVLTSKNVKKSNNHKRNYSLHLNREPKKAYQQRYFSKQIQYGNQNLNRKRQDQQQILRISLPEQTYGYKQNKNNKHHRDSNSIYDKKTLRKNNDRFDGSNEFSSRNQLQNQFQESQQILYPRHKSGNHEKAEYDQKINKLQPDNEKNKSKYSSQMISKTGSKDRIYSDENIKSGRYRMQQLNNSPFKNKNQEINNTSNSNQLMNQYSSNAINQQQETQKNKINKKNQAILKHLMKARQRGTLLFKKIKQFRQQKQSLKKENSKNQQSKQMSQQK